MSILFLFWLILIPGMVLGISRKYRNLSNRQIRVFWIPRAGDPVLQAYIEAGKEISFQTYVGHRFWFCEETGPPEPIDTPGATGADVVMSESQIIYPFMDDTSSPDLVKKMQKELDFMGSYYNRTGRQWLSYYPRNPPIFPMRPAEHIGKVYTIPLRKEASHILCDKKLPSCTNHVLPDGSDTIEIKVLTTQPRSFVIDNFLSDFECEYIIKTALPNLKRSKTVLGGTGKHREGKSGTRTSSSTWVGRRDSYIVEAVIQRLSDLIQIPNEKLHLGMNGEQLNVLRYLPGQEYTPHYDWWVSEGPQMRFASALLYFNTPKKGGETSFPIGLNEDGSEYVKLKAKKGRALMFYNVLPDGNGDKYSLHAGEKIVRGEKFVGAYWTWDPSMHGNGVSKKHSEL